MSTMLGLSVCLSCCSSSPGVFSLLSLLSCISCFFLSFVPCPFLFLPSLVLSIVCSVLPPPPLLSPVVIFYLSVLLSFDFLPASFLSFSFFFWSILLSAFPSLSVFFHFFVCLCLYICRSSFFHSSCLSGLCFVTHSDHFIIFLSSFLRCPSSFFVCISVLVSLSTSPQF